MKSLLAFVVGLTVCVWGAQPVRGDSWLSPHIRGAGSDNERYYALIVPGGDTLPAVDSIDGRRIDIGEMIAPEDSAVCFLLIRGKDSVYHTVWSATLASCPGPANILVHDQGKWVVMLDQWYGTHLGDDVVMVYNSSGRLVHNLSLSDLFPPHKLARLGRTRGSIHWLCEARILPETDILELRTISNGEIGFWSNATVCEDYVRVRLSTGNVESFRSDFDAAVASFSDSCGDRHLCPTVRYIHYRFDHPDSVVTARMHSLKLAGGTRDTLRTIYEAFSRDWLWEFGAAMKLIGRRVELAKGVSLSSKWVMLVEAGSVAHDMNMEDSLPVIVRLPDSLLTIPITPYESTFTQAILTGGEQMFNVMYQSGGDLSSILLIPLGSLSYYYAADSTYEPENNIFVTRLAFGTRIFIDLATPLRREPNR